MRQPRKIALLSVFLVLVSIGLAYAVVRAAQGPEPAKRVDVSRMVKADSGGCRRAEDPPIMVPQGLFGPAHRVLINSTVIGCGRRLDEWFRVVAYLQADHRSRKLCYGLEQPSKHAKSGGACLPVSSAVPICHGQCRLSASGLNPGRNGVSDVTVVSGAVQGRVRNLTLSVAGHGLAPAPQPIVAVVSGALAGKFGLRTDVSIVAYLVRPCLTSGQKVSVVAGMEGERSVRLRGTALAECR